MNNKVSALLNEQIQKELYSAYLYFDMSNYYSDQGLDGFSNWFYVQAQEEMDHAMLFRAYMLNNGESVNLLPIDAPKEGYEDFASPLKGALIHEQFVTASIHTIYEAAAEIKDYRAMEFLNWFIKEQGEEEKNASDLIKKFELFGHEAKGLYVLDQELKARVYSAPSLVLD
ncbi:Bacterial non-heme ferritin [bioreactor metagenome]|uniref:Bacterial non-heme ferritin n=1 Tax=bioreactor metagenome TaxID=1076179 RepID=A0A645CB02_9ZZZZ|nr:ferritin [Candidatus Pelethousia sp.]